MNDMSPKTGHVKPTFCTKASPVIKRNQKLFYELLDSGLVSHIHVTPLHGDKMGQNVAIHTDDVYGLRAYDSNTAILRISKNSCDEIGVSSMRGRYGLVEITADKDYMQFLFEGNYDNDSWFTDEDVGRWLDLAGGILQRTRAIENKDDVRPSLV